MATVLACPEYEIALELKAGLSGFPDVNSVHLLMTDHALSVWVGISDDDDQRVRHSVYEFEDEISAQFPQVLFDFHVIPVPTGRKLGEFISVAQPIFQRNIA